MADAISDMSNSGPQTSRRPARLARLQRRGRSAAGQAPELRTAHIPKPANDETFDQIAVIETAALPARPIQLVLKRAVDIVVAGGALLVMLPVLLLIAAVIRIESKGSPLFRQTRIGRDNRPFSILKFRSMYVDRGDPTGVTQTVDADTRVTMTGRALRRTNLDELPQLWNVLVGDMSIVGPRPHVPGMLAAGRPYDELVIGYDHRHAMRPGLTGLAQSRGLRGPTDNRWKAIRRVVCDVEYIRSFSLALDAKIVARTIINEIKGGTGS